MPPRVAANAEGDICPRVKSRERAEKDQGNGNTAFDLLVGDDFAANWEVLFFLDIFSYDDHRTQLLIPLHECRSTYPSFTPACSQTVTALKSPAVIPIPGPPSAVPDALVDPKPYSLHHSDLSQPKLCGVLYQGNTVTTQTLTISTTAIIPGIAQSI